MVIILYTERQQKLVTSSVRRFPKPSPSKLIIFGHREVLVFLIMDIWRKKIDGVKNEKMPFSSFVSIISELSHMFGQALAQWRARKCGEIAKDLFFSSKIIEIAHRASSTQAAYSQHSMTIHSLSILMTGFVCNRCIDHTRLTSVDIFQPQMAICKLAVRKSFRSDIVCVRIPSFRTWVRHWSIRRKIWIYHWPIPTFNRHLTAKSPYANPYADASGSTNKRAVIGLCVKQPYYVHGSNSGSCISCIRMLRCKLRRLFWIGDRLGDGPTELFLWMDPRPCSLARWTRILRIRQHIVWEESRGSTLNR